MNPDQSSSAPGSASSTEAASLLVTAWAKAWNANDMEASAGLLTEDVDFINVGGKWLSGRAEFLEYHKRIHLAQMRDSEWTNCGHEVKHVRDDLALVHFEWKIRGDHNIDDSPRAPRSGVFTWLIARSSQGWAILAAHNTDHRAGVAHRLPFDAAASAAQERMAS